MNYPGRARIQEYAEGAIKRLREDQISNKRQRVKERLSKGQFEEEAKSLASLMGMDQKEAMKLIGNKSMTPEQKIENYYDLNQLKPGLQQDVVRAITSDLGVGVAAGTTMTSGAAGLIALMQAMQGAQDNQVQREMPLQ
jgi:hypothetical protein